MSWQGQRQRQSQGQRQEQEQGQGQRQEQAPVASAAASDPAPLGDQQTFLRNLMLAMNSVSIALSCANI